MDAQELEQITNGDDNLLEIYIDDGMGYVAEMLAQRFKVFDEFDKTGSDRNRSLLRNTISIVLFYLSDRIPANMRPESRELAYDNAKEWLTQVASGERQTTLEKIEPTQGLAITWGSKVRNQDNFI